MIHQRAKQLAEMGFYIFHLIPNGKTPLKKGWQKEATNDPQKVLKSWHDPMLELFKNDNIGIYTGKFQDGALLVLDVDTKEGKKGLSSLAALKTAGHKLPKTLTQVTASGGYHLIYKVKEAVPNSVGKLGPGLDVRSKGGYIVGAGSMVPGGQYQIQNAPIADAPQWLIEKANEKKETVRETNPEAKRVNQRAAKTRGREYLIHSAPVAIEGEGGDQKTFSVASRLKDMGLTEKNALTLMLDHWNDQCKPPWLPDELAGKVKNAYSYGQNSVGADSPENDFTPVENSEKLSPIEELNQEFAFVVLGGKSTILRQTGKGEVSYMTPQAFHDLLKARTIQAANGRKMQLSELWFSSPKRASYNSVELVPGKKAPPGVYNLWRGFKCQPIDLETEVVTKEMQEGVSMFKEHLLKNICLGNEELARWVMGYFAHLVQKPYEKPLTALVFKGKKGVGKNALIDRIGNLFNGHYLLTSNKRYLTSNFNKHLANLILFVLDEAFWSGDKQAEGILKDLITGNTHLIEHKGREMFSTPNVLRVCIIGNEEWVVPASEDERRFAVFNVGDERQRDRDFFKKMRSLIDNKGGNRLLLRELLDFDLSGVDVNDAPITAGLLEQKIESLNSVHAWFFQSLKDGAFLNLDFSEGWPKEIGREQLRSAYGQYARERGIRSWLPDAGAFGRDLLKCCPSLGTRRKRDGTTRTRTYTLPSLEGARKEFDEFIGHKIEWEPTDEGDVIEMFQ